MSEPVLHPVPASETLRFRQQLYPSLAGEGLRFEKDGDEDSLHLAAEVEGARVGAVSVFRESLPEDGVRRGFRVQGLFVSPEHRGQGHGARLIDACRAHARERGASELWAYVPPQATGFFSQLGFNTEGPPELLGDLGPHFTMRLFHLEDV